MNTIGTPIDTLKLSADDADELLRILDSSGDSQENANRRTSTRFTYRRHPGLCLTVYQAGGQLRRYRVIPRNISTEGVGVLIGTFVYPQTQCQVGLLSTKGEIRRFAGAIVRVRHLRGRLHEVGIRFNEPLDLLDLIGKRAIETEGNNASFQFPQFVGSMLVIESCVDARELLRFLAGRMGLRITAVETVDAALELLDNLDFDLVYVNLDQDGQMSTSPSAQIRGMGYQRYILGATNDESESTSSQALMYGCDRVLTKPFSFDDFITVVGQFLPTRSADPAGQVRELRSTMWDYEPMRPLILGFLKRTRERSAELRPSRTRGIPDGLRAFLHELKGAAGSFGYPDLTEAAREVLDAMDRSDPDQVLTAADRTFALIDSAIRPLRRTLAA